MGIFDIFSGKKKKERRDQERRSRDSERRRIRDDAPPDRERRSDRDGRSRDPDRRRRNDGERRRRSKDPGRRRDRDERRREKGGKRRPPEERRSRPDREERGPPSGSEDDVFVIKPDGDGSTSVERKPNPKGPMNKGSYEITVGSPKLSGDGTTGEGGVLQTVLRSNITGDLKPSLKEARLKKLEKNISDMQGKVSNLEETTGTMRSDLSEIKETVSRMEIAVADVEDIKEEYNNMEKSLRELSALYDLLSGYTNPFVEGVEIPRKASDKFEGVSIDDEIRGPGEALSEDELDRISADINPFIDDMEPSKPVVKTTPAPETKEPAAPLGEPPEPKKDQINSDFWMLKWAKYLSDKVSQTQIGNLLDYYKDLGWIDEGIQEKMLNYFQGSRIDVTEDEMFEPDMIITEDGKVITEESDDAWKITMDDHTKSLEFIGKIKTNAEIT